MADAWTASPDELDSDDARFDAPSCQPTADRRHELNCYVLTETIRRACDPALPQWGEYRGDLIVNAVWWAKETLRHARRLGLLAPDAHQQAA